MVGDVKWMMVNVLGFRFENLFGWLKKKKNCGYNI